MHNVRFFLLILAITLFLPIFPQQLLAKSRWAKIQIAQKDTLHVEVVTLRKDMELGLGNRKGLQQGKGMLFLYARPGQRIFWMKGMRFALDIIWIRNNRIVHIKKNIPPPSLMIADRHLARYGKGIYADMVLEVPAGYSEKKRYTLDDSVKLLSSNRNKRE